LVQSLTKIFSVQDRSSSKLISLLLSRPDPGTHIDDIRVDTWPGFCPGQHATTACGIEWKPFTTHLGSPSAPPAAEAQGHFPVDERPPFRGTGDRRSSPY